MNQKESFDQNEFLFSNLSIALEENVNIEKNNKV